MMMLHLFLASTQSVRDGLSCGRGGVLGRLEVALARVLGVIGTGASRVRKFLGGRLVTLWLQGAGHLVTETSDVLGSFVESGLLGVRGDLLLDLLADTFTSAITSRVSQVKYQR